MFRALQFACGLVLLAFEAGAGLPLSKTFVGEREFQQLMDRGVRENWARLPIGERTARVGLSLTGVPYENFTLELHDRIEAPAVNMRGMDCWTFFEISLAAARLLQATEPPYTPRQMLALIEADRYRGGRCDGTFFSRLHHLEDWAHDNERRGLVRDITRQLGGQRLHREVAYMGTAWRNFRQLRVDQSMIPRFQKLERDLSRRGIYYLPKSQVRGVERRIQNGDIICIVGTWHGTYTTHVGLACRDRAGHLRFLHASRNHKEVLLDKPLTEYLNSFRNHAGIMVVRPQEGRFRFR